MVPEGGECTHRTELTASPPFDELYNEYKDRVFCFAYYLTQNRREAEDLFPDMSGIIHSNLSDETSYADMGRDIARAIACLPDRQRRVFLLKEIVGFQQSWL